MNKLLAMMLLLASGCHSEENLGFTVVGEPRWAVGLGGTGDDRGMHVAFDSIGDVIACGDFFGPADFGGGLATTGGPWAFITKRVASDGAERWTKRLLGVTLRSSVYIGALAVTPQDEVVVAGSYFGTIDFGGQTLELEQPDPPDHQDMFLAKYASDGQLLWVRGLAEYSNATGTALAIDENGGIYATAVFLRGTLVLGGEIYREPDGDHDTLLIAYNSDGTRRWFHVFQGASGPYSRSITLAPNGDVLVGGSFGAPASFGGAVINPDARVRGFVTRFRNDGLYLASYPVGPTAPFSSMGPDVRVDSTGRIVLQQVEVDESDGVSLSNQGSTIRLVSDNGAELWSTRIQNNGRYSPQARALLTTPDGLIASAAWTDNPVSLMSSMEVVTFASDGSNTVTTFGGGAPSNRSGTFVFSAAAATSGAIAFAGAFGGMVDLGTGPMTTHGTGDSDVFIGVTDPPVAAGLP